MLDKTEQLKRLWEIIKLCFESDFYGEVNIKFEAGKIVLLEERKKIKL